MRRTMLICGMEISAPGFEARWREGCAGLARADPIMCSLIVRYPGERLAPHGDLFASLSRAVVGQQISVLAAERIWSRVADLVAEVTPESVLGADPVALRGCGLTARKTDYIRGLAGEARVNRDGWAALCDVPDEAVFVALTRLHGVGPWTAQMAMIFALGRLDVLPAGDVGLQRVAGERYGCQRSRQALAGLAQAWRPWRTIAVWYLWRDLDPVPVAY